MFAGEDGPYRAAGGATPWAAGRQSGDPRSQDADNPLYVNVEIITPDHHVVSQHEELSQWCILRENTYTLKFL